MKRELFLGIDTSNYTTSVAVVDADGVIANIKRPLPVKEGERGLRQSDALFAHIKNLPDALDEAREYISRGELMAVGVSEKPRNIEGSYMPCFLAGVCAAESASAVTGAPIYRFSHQCGHIMAALLSSGRSDLIKFGFPAFHISGGTTELLSVQPSEDGFLTEIVGGTSDLNAGQVIDRIGVYMGLRFPAGREIERLALRCEKIPPRKAPSVKGMRASLSGLENLAISLYDDTKDKSLVSLFVLTYIGEAISKMSESYVKKYGDTPILYAGGVMSNTVIKNMLSARFDAHFAEPSLSSDNAVGVAELARRAYIKRQEQEK